MDSETTSGVTYMRMNKTYKWKSVEKCIVCLFYFNVKGKNKIYKLADIYIYIQMGTEEWC